MNLDLPLMPSSIASSQENSLFLKALKCQNSGGRPPVWIMRQAGRYLPEYQTLRARHSLEELFRQPEHILEVTQQPLKRFPIDAAILFADILHVLLPLGCDVRFPKVGGPQVVRPKQFEKRSVEETLGFVKEGILLLKKELKVPLIGFCGGPFTVAHYLLDKKPERLLYEDPHAFMALLDQLTEVSKEYLELQIDAGVDAIQIFDSWAGTLPRKELKRVVLPQLKKLVDSVSVPVIIFSRGSSFYVEEFLSLHSEGISFDGNRPLAEIRREVPKSVAVQGNLPPEFLYGSPEFIRSETKAFLDSMAGDPGFIVNLGHGILPDIPTDHVQAFIETVLSF